MSDAYSFEDYLSSTRRLVEGLQSEPVQEACDVLEAVFRHNGTVFACGNGGSAADAQHWAAELVSRFNYDRPGLPAIALTTDTSALTAIGNDYGYDYVFARQVGQGKGPVNLPNGAAPQPVEA